MPWRDSCIGSGCRSTENDSDDGVLRRALGSLLVAASIRASSDPAITAVNVCRMAPAVATVQPDVLAVEEPLEIRLACTIDGAPGQRAISITMRTPGDDHELAVGFLFTEGILTAREQVAGVHSCGADVTCVKLQPDVAVNFKRLERNFYTASSCGVCGKASLEAVRVCACHRLRKHRPVVDAEVIHRLPEALRAGQNVFDRTGGLHAAALFDVHGQRPCLREDVGRHNALDKLIGAQFLSGRTPLLEDVLLVSGRASFELVQKAAVAGIPILAAVGAPPSLAVSLAREHHMTVLGFVRHVVQHLHRPGTHSEFAGRSHFGLSPVREVVTMFRLPLSSDVDLAREPYSRQTAAKGSRLRGATVTEGVCPYCAVGCGQIIYTKAGKIIDIEGNPESPINEGTLCPKGANAFQLAVNPHRVTHVLYRALFGQVGDAPMEWALDRIADGQGGAGRRLHGACRRPPAQLRAHHRHLGGATIDNEENYLIKKLFGGGLGVVSIENQARI